MCVKAEESLLPSSRQLVEVLVFGLRLIPFFGSCKEEHPYQAKVD